MNLPLQMEMPTPATTHPLAGQTMSGAEVVVQVLADEGVSVLFGYSGGAILPVYDAVFRFNATHLSPLGGEPMPLIVPANEQGAGFMAAGYARASGKVGVAIVTSGPGATNVITGLADALLDSIPIVVITGQVPTHLIGTDAFQEADTVGITRHCTKHNYLVKDPAQLGAVVHEAFHIATSGRPGPVVIDLPKDVQIASASYTAPTAPLQHKTYRPQVKPEPTLIDRREQVMDPMTAYQITSIMEGVVQRGTATVLREVGKPIAGKTGTTNDEKDVWFVGFSPDIAVGVYVGYDKPRNLGRGATGGHLAAPIAKDFLKLALAGKPAVPFKVPAGIKLIRVDAKTGMRAGPGDSGRTILEAFKPGTAPPDNYSIIGVADADGHSTVSPDADRAVIRPGTGGLY